MNEIAGDQGGPDYVIPKRVMDRLGGSWPPPYTPDPSAFETVAEEITRPRSQKPYPVALTPEDRELLKEIRKPTPEPEPTVYYIDDRTGKLDVTPELMATLATLLPEHQEGDFSVTADADSFISLLEATGATVKRFADWGDE